LLDFFTSFFAGITDFCVTFLVARGRDGLTAALVFARGFVGFVDDFLVEAFGTGFFATGFFTGPVFLSVFSADFFAVVTFFAADFLARDFDFVATFFAGFFVAMMRHLTQ
jgi:hypothetical protein